MHLSGRDSLSEVYCQVDLMYLFGRDNLLRYAYQVDLSSSDPWQVDFSGRYPSESCTSLVGTTCQRCACHSQVGTPVRAVLVR